MIDRLDALQRHGREGEVGKGAAADLDGTGDVAALVRRSVAERALERMEGTGHRGPSSLASRRRNEAVATLASLRAPLAVIPMIVAMRSYDMSAR